MPDPSAIGVIARFLWRLRELFAGPMTSGEGLDEESRARVGSTPAMRRPPAGEGERHRTALCLSGGGIRSATFALGVLEGLARLDLLRRVDYLSTVSGGGFIGSWLTAWCAREPGGIAQVSRDLSGGDARPARYLALNREYLAPVAGDSAAISVAAASLFRILATWFVLLPALSAPYALMFAAGAIPRIDLWDTGTGTWVVLLLGLSCALPWAFLCSRIVSPRPEHGSRGRFLRMFLVPVTAWALLSAVLIGNGSMSPAGAAAIVGAAGLFAAVYVPVVWVSIENLAVHWARRALAAVLVLGAAAVEAAIVAAIPVDSYRRLAEISPSALACLLLFAQWIAGSLVRIGAPMPWWSRARSWLLGAGLSLLLARGMLDLAAAPLWSSRWALGAVEAVGLAAGLVCLVSGFQSAAEALSRRKARPSVASSLLVGLCALVALGVLMLDQAWLAHAVVAWLRQTSYGSERALWLAPIALCAVPYVLGFAVDLNRLSLHPLYRDGLVAAFLGASRPGRSPDPLTGLDPEDDVDLSPGPVAGPYHVICAAVRAGAGSAIAGGRLTESFTFTAQSAGSAATGYRSCGAFFGRVTLGTAMAVSGAAVSPSIVRRSSLATELLRTLLNVRLGLWVGNPRCRFAWRFRRPLHPLHVLLAEITGSSGLDSSYLYVTDGGHFENLGLYEMVRRGCDGMVVVDAGHDPALTFEDLANARARIRADFGAIVDVDVTGIGPAGAGGRRWALGTVSYPGGRVGEIVYIKPVILGDEDLEVANYHDLNPEFPHESTADQFYSEAQFDAYRSLGRQSAVAARAELLRVLA